MNSSRRRRAGAAAIAVLVVSGVTMIATPAHAAPWDGNDVPYPPGEWNADWNDFKLTDIALRLPDTTLVNTDIWDDAGVTRISSASLGLGNSSPNCASIAAVDVQNPEVATGDLVLSCANADQTIIDAGLDVEMEIRVLAGGEIVRFMTSITNASTSAVTIDQVRTWVNHGGVGQLWDYDKQADSILSVPTSDGTNNDDDLNVADARWIVHWHPIDAPASWVVGNDFSAVGGTWGAAIADDYNYLHDGFVIPAGETRRVAVFVVWSPDELLAGGWNGVDTVEAANNSSADAIVEKILAIRDLSGVYGNGIADLSEVVNWGPAPVVADPEEPELAATGAGDAASVVMLGMLLLVLGGVLVARRRAGEAARPRRHAHGAGPDAPKRLA